MKKVYKQQFNGYKKNNHLDKNAIARYILLAFFAFVFIGSILGIVAFSRTNKKDSAFNVVSANADVIDEIGSNYSLNLTNYHLKTAPSTANQALSLMHNSAGQRYLHCYTKNFDGFEQRPIPLMPFDNYIIDDSSQYNFLYVAFTISFTGRYIYSDMVYPKVMLNFYSEDFIDESFTMNCTRNPYVPGCGFTYSCMVYPGFYRFDRSFIEVEYPQYDDLAGYFTYFDIYSIQVKTEPSYSSYAYTLDELDSIYKNEIEKSYYEGMQTTDGYQTGYDDGYKVAQDEMDIVLNGLLIESNCTLNVNDELGTRKIRYDNVNHESSLGVDISSILSSTGGIYGYDFGDMAFWTFGLTFENFPIKVPVLANYSFELTFDSWRDDLKVTDLGFRIDINTNGNTYSSVVTKIDTYTYHFFVDLTSAKSFEQVTSINFVSYCAFFAGTGGRLANQDTRYALGYDSGFHNAYLQFRDEFAAQLQNEYELGFNAAKKTAYNEGFNAGVESAGQHNFKSLIGAVVDVPVKTFTNLFNFELLGINLANFFYALLTCCIILAVVKLIL